MGGEGAGRGECLAGEQGGWQPVQVAPAHVLQRVPVVDHGAVEPDCIQNRPSPGTDRRAPLVDAQVVVAGTRGQIQCTGSDGAREGDVGCRDVRAAVPDRRSPIAQVFQGLGGDPVFVRMGTQEGRGQRQELRPPFIVRVHEGDEATRGGSDAGIAGCRHTLVGLADEPDARIQSVESLDRAVVRAVIDHQQFPVLVGLQKNAGNGAPDHVDAVVGRQDDRDFWHWTVPLVFSGIVWSGSQIP